jgi:hypothetical protein
MIIKSMDGQRWFIWTLVFLLAAGIALTTYISLSTITVAENDFSPFPVHHPKPLAKIHK